MKRIPQRASLVSQTAEILREAIAGGQWPRWLPGEHELARRLQVSRVTLRSALEQLEREKLLRSGQGRRREVLHQRAARRPASPNNIVVLLSPAPLHQLPVSVVFWIDKLRGNLDAAGWKLEVHESAGAYRRRPAHALEELTARLRPAGWVLYRSTPEMQRWFHEHTQSAVIAGSRHPGVQLSAVDVDYAAGCRHAAGWLLAAGHRHLAVVRPDTKLAGDLDSVAGFQAGAAAAEVRLVLHDGTVRGLCGSLERLFMRPPFPTALLVFHAAHLLTVLGWLQQRPLRIPGEISVLCRDDEPFLDSVLPTPTRYTVHAEMMARQLARLVTKLVSGGSALPRQHRIMPTFVRGQTVGPVPASSGIHMY